MVNVPGSDIAKGDVIAEYVGSGPGNGSGATQVYLFLNRLLFCAGLHRYTWAVLRQPGKVDPTKLTKINNRTCVPRLPGVR